MPFGEDGSVVRREFARQAETFVKIDEKLDCTAYTRTGLYGMYHRGGGRI